MGLESFYLAVKTAIFSSRGSPPRTPLCGWGPPPDPRVRSQRPQNLELGYRQKSPLPVRPRVHNVTTARDLQAHRASDARRRTSHGQLARNNLSTLKGLNAQPGVTVTVRAGAGPPPARLQRIADQAAQSGDLRSRHPADCASCANAPWDELRVWDPGD